MATPTEIQNVRFELGDTDTSFPMLSDAEYTYYIDKNTGSLRRATIDCAKAILFKLSMRGDETVDIFSIRGSKTAENYRMALQMFLRDPSMNPALALTSVYAGGISKSDMQANIDNADNNAIVVPAAVDGSSNDNSDNPFAV